jgi:tetratricopeptide (TPR) repeat protein
VQAYEKGNSQTAVDSFTRALAIRPQSTELLFARGQAYRQEKDFVLAERDFQAVYNKSGNPEMLWFVGQCNLKRGSYDPAIGNFEKAEAAGFTTLPLRHNVALSLSRTNQAGQALLELDKVLKADPKLALSHHLRARLRFYGAAGKQQPIPDSVQEDIRAALSEIRDDPLIHLDAACIFHYPKQSHPDDDEALRQLRLSVQAGMNPLQLRSEWLFLGKLPEGLSPEEN